MKARLKGYVDYMVYHNNEDEIIAWSNSFGDKARWELFCDEFIDTDGRKIKKMIHFTFYPYQKESGVELAGTTFPMSYDIKLQDGWGVIRNKQGQYITEPKFEFKFERIDF